MDFKIRRAKLTDLKAIQQLNHQLFAYDDKFDSALNKHWPLSSFGLAYFKKSLTHARALALVAVVKDQVVGYLIGWILVKRPYRPIKTAELENMFVMKKYRRLGIGKALVNRLLQWCHQKRVKSVEVWSYNQNYLGQKFYPSCGLKPICQKFELLI